MVLFGAALIALLYPSSVIAEDGTNLDPSPIWKMALEAKGGASALPKEQEKPKQVSVAPQKAPESSVSVVSSVSAYTSSEAETDSTPDITASGTRTGVQTAACPSRYPFGTRIQVAGRTYVCEDRMHPRYREGNYFDIWMPSYSQAIQWGRRTVEVKVLQ